MKQILRKIYGAAVVLLGTTLALTTLSCTHDIDNAEYPAVDADGNVTISLPLSVPDVEVRTRAQSITDTAIETLWIGLFATDGNIADDGVLVKTWDLTEVSIAGGSGKLNLICPNGTLADGSSYHLVAVANYQNVRARMSDGEPQDPVTGRDIYLIDLLRKERMSWEDFCKITVDTESAAAQKYPVMQGLLTKENKARDFMILPESFQLHAGNYNIFSATALKQGTTGGTLYLRRLIAGITVNVNLASFGSEYSAVEVDNIRYAVVNKPKEVYLHERMVPENQDNANDTFAGIRARTGNVPADVLTDRETYLRYSPNVNDTTPDGFYNTFDDMEFESVAGKYTTGNTFSFQYNRFESKHTGDAANIADYYGREAVDGATRDTEGRFTALCPDPSCLANNYAPYFVLLADIALHKSNGESFNVTARYVIHEGYANDFEGENNVNTTISLNDFSCYRNTNYIYSLTIKGINNILVQVSLGNGTPRNGVSGDVFDVVDFAELDGNKNGYLPDNDGVYEWEFSLTNRERSNIGDNWLFITPYRVKNDDGSWSYRQVEVGNPNVVVPAASPVKRSAESDFYDGTAVTLDGNQFVDWVQFYDDSDTPIGNIAAFASTLPDGETADGTLHIYTIRVPEDHSYANAYDPESPTLTGAAQASWLSRLEDARAFYFNVDSTPGADNLSSFQKMFYLTQEPEDRRLGKLDAPELTYDDSAPVYVNDYAMLSWTSVDNAGDYELFDEDDWSVETAGETSYRYLVPADKSYGDRLDFEVVAKPENIAEYEDSDRSEPLSIQVYKRSQTWNFSDAIWTNDQKFKNATTATTDLNITHEGLTVIPGTNGMLTGNVSGEYYIRTNGTGNKDSRALAFPIPASGSITIKVSNTGSSQANDRFVNVQVGEDAANTQSKVGGFANNNIQSVSFNVSVTEVTMVYIYTTQSLNIYEIRYNAGVFSPTEWSATGSDSGVWTQFISKLASSPTEEFRYDNSGLAIYNAGGDAKITSNEANGYVQMTQSGGPFEQHLSFRATSAGTLTITISGTGSTAKGDGRKLAVQVGDGDPDEKDADFTASDRKTLQYNVEVTEPTVVKIYPSGIPTSYACGTRIYSITFTGGIDYDYTGQ